MQTEYEAIRDYIVDAVVTVWGGTVNPDPAEIPHTSLPYTVVSLADVSIRNETPVTDEIDFGIQIVGTFDRPSSGSIDALVIENASDLRTELLADNNPGTHGYLPMVTRFERIEGDEGDDRVHILVRFECKASVSR